MKAINSLVISMTLMAVFACSKEGSPVDKTPTDGEPAEAYLTIASTTTTRGITDGFVDGTNDENAIKTLEFYVFDKVTGLPDTETNATAGEEGYVKITTANNQKIHKIKMKGGSKIIVAVINMNLGVPAINKYSELKAEIAKWEYSHNNTDGYNARTESRPSGFEMTGEKDFTIAAGSVNNSISLNVARLSSRVNAPTFKASDPGFINLKDSHLAEIWEDKVDEIKGKALEFVNQGYVVINGRSKSDAFFIGNPEGDDRKTTTTTIDGEVYVKPDWSSWSGSGKTPLESSFDNDGFYTNTYSGKGTADDWFLDGSITGEHRVYLYENKPDEKTQVSGGSTIKGYDPKSTVALIIKGTFVVDNDPANTLNRTRYWRVDLTRDDDYHVYRNASYSITINQISTPGFGTPEEAEDKEGIIPGKEETTADITIVVNGWRLNDYQTGM